jgi:hypothetical protein
LTAVKLAKAVLSEYPDDKLAYKVIELIEAKEHISKPRCLLQYNKATKKIDRVRQDTGLVVDSFDPPEGQ